MTEVDLLATGASWRSRRRWRSCCWSRTSSRRRASRRRAQWPATLAIVRAVRARGDGVDAADPVGGGGIDISIGPLMNFVEHRDRRGADPARPRQRRGRHPDRARLGAASGCINGLLVAVSPLPAGDRHAVHVVRRSTGAELKLAQPAAIRQHGLARRTWRGKVGPIPGAPLIARSRGGPDLARARRPPLPATLYAVGGDDATAYSAGVNVTAVRIVAYALGGLFAAVAGIALAAAAQSGDASQGIQYTLRRAGRGRARRHVAVGGRGALLGSIARRGGHLPHPEPARTPGGLRPVAPARLRRRC